MDVAVLTETSVYSPSITKVDPNSDIANQELANRTLYLKNFVDSLNDLLDTFKNDTTNDINLIQSNIANIQRTLDSITSDSTSATNLINKLSDITDEIAEIKAKLASHTHNYAGSASPSGDANTVAVIEDNISVLNLVGSTEATPNKLRRNSHISMENDTLTAATFKGDLEGLANEATRLANNPKITLSGDVVGSVDFSGDSDVIITTSIKEQEVSPGSYGPNENITIAANDSFRIPLISVNSTGLVTSIRNRTLTLSKSLAQNGITTTNPTTKKLFILGSPEQSDSGQVFTQNDVFIDNNRVYSHGYETINTDDAQSLNNKTYNGYRLGDACSYGVDDTIGGTKDDNRLVTSNALNRHTHLYAGSDEIGGAANYVKLGSEQDGNKSYLITSYGSNGALTKTDKAYTDDNGLNVTSLNVQDKMYIPGAQIWVDSVEVPSKSDTWSGDASVIQSLDNRREVNLIPSVSCLAGTILEYTDGGYQIANPYSTNIVLAVSDSLDGKIVVIDYGVYDTSDALHDGQDCYIGRGGKIVYGAGETKIGYMQENYFVFKPVIGMIDVNAYNVKQGVRKVCQDLIEEAVMEGSDISEEMVRRFIDEAIDEYVNAENRYANDDDIQEIFYRAMHVELEYAIESDISDLMEGRTWDTSIWMRGHADEFIGTNDINWMIANSDWEKTWRGDGYATQEDIEGMFA